MKALMSSFAQDVRHAGRLWRGTPGLTAAVLTTLTLSIGAATAVFTFFDVLLLRSLPVRVPVELHAVAPTTGRNLDLDPFYFSYEFYTQLRDADPRFRDLFASSTVASSGVHLSAGGSAARLRAELVSGNYFRVLGIPARIGRTITEEDDRSTGAHAAVVLSDAAWQRWFGSRTDIVGQSIRLNGYTYTVIGVTGEEFFGTRAGFTPDLWVPLSMTAQMAAGPKPSRNSNYIELMLRVVPDSSKVALESALTAAYREWMSATSTPPAGAAASLQQPALRLVPAGRGLSLLRGQYGQPLRILLSAVVLLLIIACANIANLLLARGMARRRELAIRLSQGATRSRITRQLVTECLLLTVAGGALGWLAAVAMGLGMLKFLPDIAATWQFWPSGRALLFTTGVVTLAGLAFGLVPSRIAGRLDVSQALRKDTLEGGLQFRRFAGQNLLSVVQLALSLVLVVATFLFVRTLHNIRSVDTGFQPDHVLLAALDPVNGGYPEARARILYEDVLKRIRAEPGVRAAGLASYGSLSGVRAAGTRFMSTPMHAARQVVPPSADPTVYINIVTPGYFDAVGMPMHRGRDFLPQDSPSSLKVAIINETAARYFFGETDPVGQRIGTGRTGPADLEVVGVVRDAKYLNLREDARRTVYRPHAQAYHSLMTLHVSTAGDPSALIPLVRRAVHALDPTQPLFNVQTMQGRMNESLRQERLVTTLASGLGGLGALLAVVGVYGVVSYAVSRRRRELAIRIAVGASPGQVLSSVLQQSLRIALGGVALGIPLAVMSTRLYETFLFGITRTDASIVCGAALALVALALVAGYLPARQAVRIEPLIALREE